MTHMLREIEARQRRDEPRRRWFYSKDFELVVWLDERDSILGFQLAYDKETRPHALTWRAPDTLNHSAVDTGETHPLKPKGSPILVANGAFEQDRLSRLFRAASTHVPAEYAHLVEMKIRQFAKDA